MAKETYIFNIQHYSLHDGPGIRTIVFLKGCPMRCRWCCNPESHRYVREISYVENKCIGKKECGICAEICPYGAITFGKEQKAVIDRNRCEDCLACARQCPSCAIKEEGKKYTVEEVIKIVERDAVFYSRGNGGLTISGGEPLSHSGFLIELLKEAKRRRIHTAIETCGYADYEVLAETARYLDMILYDIKSMDEQKHMEYTGYSNDKIIRNFQSLCRDYPKLPKKVRTPVIPGFNDNPEQIENIKKFLADKPNVTHELLPYHTFGKGKYKALGRKYEMEDI
ncbi:MAG: glycyl-radical enzyme activating protein [Muricomes sp.]